MSLGDLEQLVLLALARLGREAYGAAIAVEIEEGVGRAVTPGALYTVLERMAAKGYVESWIGDSTPERGGRKRKMYRILPLGARELSTWYSGVSAMASTVLDDLDDLAREEG